MWVIKGTTDKTDLNWSELSGNSTIGAHNQGGGSTFADLNDNGKPDLILMAVDNPAGRNNIRYKIGWDLDETGAVSGGWGAVNRVTLDKKFASLHDGGGVAVGYIDNNGSLDMLVMGIADTAANNEFQYAIGWNLDDQGNAASWSNVIEVSGIGSVTDGGGATIYDIDKNGRPDLVLMGIDNPDGHNQFRYRIGWNLSDKGIPASWSNVKQVNAEGGLGWYHAGGGATLGDINGNGTPEMVFMAVDDPEGTNNFRYRVGWDINTSGNIVNWSDLRETDGVGDFTAGGGAGMADLDDNGQQELLFMAIDDPQGENQFRYKIGWNITNTGVVHESNWSSPVNVATGSSSTWGYNHVGGGIAVADIDGNNIPDVVVMGLQEGSSNNPDYFEWHIGWNVNPEGLPSRWEKKLSTRAGYEGRGGGAEVADITGDGELEVIFMMLEETIGSDDKLSYRYATLNDQGNPLKWTMGQIALPYSSDNCYDCGMSIGYIDDNETPDMVYTFTTGENENYYVVGLNFYHYQKDAVSYYVPETWLEPVSLYQVASSRDQGGGVALADLNQNGKADLVIMNIQGITGNNAFRYFLGLDLAPKYGDQIKLISSEAKSWTRRIETFSNQLHKYTDGGGATIADVTNDGKLDLLLMSVDAIDGERDQLRYAVGKNIGEGRH